MKYEKHSCLDWLYIHMSFVFPIFILDTLLILASVFLCQSLSFSLCQGIGLLILWEPNSGNKKHWGYWFNWLTPDNHQIKIFTIMTLKNIPPCNKDHSQIKSSQFLFHKTRHLFLGIKHPLYKIIFFMSPMFAIDRTFVKIVVTTG